MLRQELEGYYEKADKLQKVSVGIGMGPGQDNRLGTSALGQLFFIVVSLQ